MAVNRRSIALLKSILLIAAALLAFNSLKADSDWQVLSHYGLLADIHTANVKVAYNTWRHTAIITPLMTDEGIRTWCNGVELGTCLISDPATQNRTDHQEGAEWNWVFQLDVNGEAQTVETYVRKKD
jgi:hypothetical protein